MLFVFFKNTIALIFHTFEGLNKSDDIFEEYTCTIVVVNTMLVILSKNATAPVLHPLEIK